MSQTFREMTCAIILCWDNNPTILIYITIFPILPNYSKAFMKWPCIFKHWPYDNITVAIFITIFSSRI